MGKFFSCLVSENLIDDWAPVLDRLFDDLKFSKSRKWNGGYTSSFTKKIKRLKYMSDKEKRVLHGKCNRNDFPNQNNSSKRKLYIAMTKGEGFARDLIRCIRNGIAHGDASIKKCGAELYVEIIDYSDTTKRLDEQTAYLFIPLSYVKRFWIIYNDINESIMNTKSKDRKLTKKNKKEQ